MSQNVEEMLREFIQEYAVRFSIPELLGVVPVKLGDASACMEDWTNFVPTGQFSSIVSKGAIMIAASEDLFGFITAEVRTTYEHVGGGTNGYRVSYMLLTEQDILNKRTYYKGFMPYDRFTALMHKYNKKLEAISGSDL